MIELFKKGLFTGLGLIVITAEEAEKRINSLVEKGKLSAEEGESLIKEFIQKSEDQQTHIQERISKSIKSALDSLDIAGREQVDNLEARVSSMEDRISTLESLHLEEEKKSE